MPTGSGMLKKYMTKEKLAKLYERHGGVKRSNDAAVAEEVTSIIYLDGADYTITESSLFSYRQKIGLVAFRREKKEEAVEPPATAPEVPSESEIPTEDRLQVGDEVCVWMSGGVILTGRITFIPETDTQLWHVRSNATGLLTAINPQSSRFESFAQK